MESDRREGGELVSGVRRFGPEVTFLYDDGLTPLENATQLTIEESTGFQSSYECNFHFDIVDQNGLRLFHVAETSRRILHLFSTMPARLQFVLLGYGGQPALIVSGYDEYCGYPTDFSVEGVRGHFGHILQKRGHLCGRTRYYVCDRNQELLYRVSASHFECACIGVSGNFGISKKEDRQHKLCGTINKVGSDENPKGKRMYSVVLEDDFNTAQKALVMIMAVVLNLRGYKSGKRKGRPYWTKPSKDSV